VAGKEFGVAKQRAEGGLSTRGACSASPVFEELLQYVAAQQVAPPQAY